MTQKTCGMFQRSNRSRLLLLGAKDAYIDLGMAQIAANANVRNAGESHPRIFHTSTQPITEFYSDQFAKFLLPVRIWHTSTTFYAPRFTRSRAHPSLLTPASYSPTS